MRLYGYAGSSNVQKALFMLAELGLDYELHEVPAPKPRPDWYLELNPLGLVPALVDGDLTLPESHAILRYLAAREHRDDLYPTALAERARVDCLLDAIATTFRPASLPIEMVALGFKPGEGFSPDRVESGRTAGVIAEQAPVLERFLGLLGHEPWAVLHRFTIADVAAAPFLWRLAHAEAVTARLPRLASWASAVTARPAFAGVAAGSGL
jgi:glutathione S-transferase